MLYKIVIGGAFNQDLLEAPFGGSGRHCGHAKLQ